MLERSENLIAARLEAESRGIVVYLLALTGSRDLAEELHQETCLQVWRHRERYDPARDFGAWVRGIARNVASRHWRAKRRDQVLPLTPEVVSTLESCFAASEVEGALGGRRAALNACLGELPEPQRRVLRLHYAERWTMKRIAQEIGRTSDAVKMLVSRMRRRLSECCQRRMAREQQHG